MRKLSMGIDIGGSHITCQLFNLVENRPEEATKVRTDVNGNGLKEEILESWGKAIRQCISILNVRDLAGIGFAMPGPFDYLNGVAWFDENVDKFRSLNGVDVRSEIIRRLDLPDNFPVRFLNDAACFAVGVANTEPATKFSRIIALTLGTGFGTTFIKNGLPVAGEDGVPDDGFLYHIPFQQSIADEYFSTRWFLREYKKLTGKDAGGVKEIAQLAEYDYVVKGLFEIFGTNLGIFLSEWIRKFNAGCVVIGGNISKSYPLFEQTFKLQLENRNINVEVFIAELDENAALTGSARLCDDSFYKKLVKTKIIK